MRLLASIRSGPQFLSGNRRLLFFCLLLFLVSSLLSFWFFFPADVLQRYLVKEVAQQTGLRMAGSRAEMLFPFGLELDLKVYPKQVELTPLLFRDLRATPVWTRLLAGEQAVDLQAKLSGGRVEAQADPDGQLQLELRGVEIGPLQQSSLPYRLQGKLN
ncbi:MAG: hypothetical protein GXP51_12605, partial [Deltaproteobacteria bacterium]|nr:hypothetical protein [Deltaproteobacteria bacterium]